MIKEAEELKDFHTFIKDSQQSHANELANERDLYEGQRDEAIEEVKELKEKMEDMYDEEGAKECCEMLGFVRQEDHEELQKAYKETKIELHNFGKRAKQMTAEGVMSYLKEAEEEENENFMEMVVKMMAKDYSDHNSHLQGEVKELKKQITEMKN